MTSYQTIKSNQIHLNSSQATTINGSLKSDATFYFKNIIQLTDNTIELRVSLVNAQIPQSFYKINKTNNYIRVNGYEYAFPYGNYSVASFITQWKTTIGNSWTLTYSTITNKITFYNNAQSFYISDIGLANYSMLPVLGFVVGQSYFSDTSTFYLTAPYCMDFTGYRRLLINCPTFNIRNITSYDEAVNKVLSSIPVTTNSDIIQYLNLTNFKSIFKVSELSNIQIQITDDKGNLIDFNNCDWCLTLQIDNVCEEEIHALGNIHDIYEFETEKLNSSE
jgi:hypothetical protein